MKNLVNRMWNEEDGVLTFEWVLLVTLLVIGIIGGIAGVRDAIISEMGDIAEAMLSLDQSYVVCNPLVFYVHDLCDQGGSGSQFIDTNEWLGDCDRTLIPGQGVVIGGP